MTSLPSLDPGTFPQAALPGAADLAPPAQAGAGEARTQGFAALIGQLPGAAATGAPALPDSAIATSAGVETAVETGAATATPEAMPDVLAQMLRPVQDVVAQDGLPPSADGEDLPAAMDQLADTDSATDVGSDITADNAVEMAEPGQPDPGLAPMDMPTSISEQLPEGATQVTQDVPNRPEPSQDDTAAGADLPASATPTEPTVASAPVAGAATTTATSASEKTSTLAISAGKAAAAGPTNPATDAGAGRVTHADSQDTQAAGPDTAPDKPDPVPPLPQDPLPQADTPRPVNLSISQAPAPAPGQTTAPSAAAPVIPTTQADWPLDLATELAATASLRSFANGGMMEIRLDPEALGQVTLRLEVTDGTANVAIVTQTPEAARLFTDNQHRLAEALARAGLDLGQHSAGTGGQTGQQGRERPAEPPRQPGPTGLEAPAPPPQTGAAPRDRRIDLIA